MTSFTRSVFIQVLALLFLGNLISEAKEPAKAALPEDAVAVVNGAPISKKDYDLLVSQYESMNPQRFQAMPPAEREQLLSGILDRSIMIELQIQEALRRGIEVPEELVEQEYEAFKAQFPSEKEFFETLQKGKTSPAIWKEGKHNALLMRKLEQAMADELVISEEEIQQYWNQNRGAVQKDRVHARQILVRTEAEAKEVQIALKGGIPFEEAVQKYSVDPLTKTKEGDLGWLSQGEGFKEFQQAVFSLGPLQLSDPIRGKYGYHVVQVLEKKKAEETSLPDYREKIRNVIRGQKWQAKRAAWLQELKARATIQYR